MRDRVRSIKRMLDVQRHLHSLEELKYVRLQQQLEKYNDERKALSDALSSEDALHGLFTDMTVRRLKRLENEQARLLPEVEAQAAVVLKHGGLLRNTERLAEELSVELARDEERAELERLIEAGLAAGGASSKQDP
jgi:predicted methyltransferase